MIKQELKTIEMQIDKNKFLEFLKGFDVISNDNIVLDFNKNGIRIIQSNNSKSCIRVAHFEADGENFNFDSFDFVHLGIYNYPKVLKYIKLISDDVLNLKMNVVVLDDVEKKFHSDVVALGKHLQISGSQTEIQIPGMDYSAMTKTLPENNLKQFLNKEKDVLFSFKMSSSDVKKIIELSNIDKTEQKINLEIDSNSEICFKNDYFTFKLIGQSAHSVSNSKFEIFTPNLILSESDYDIFVKSFKNNTIVFCCHSDNDFVVFSSMSN